ncbi:hypothetical protein MBLNU230_g4369t1 [Neophaeotheca triangularis]
MDHFDFNHPDALLGFGDFNNDPRAQSYPLYYPQAPTAWPPLPYDHLNSDDMTQAHHQHQANQQRTQQRAQLPQQLPQQQQQPQPLHQGYPAMPSAPAQQQQQSSRPSSSQQSQPMQFQSNGLGLEYASLLPSDWQYQLEQAAQQQHFMGQSGAAMNPNSYNPSFGGLQPSPVNFMPATSADNYSLSAGMAPNTYMTMAGPMDSMNSLVYPLNDYQNEMMFPMAMPHPVGHQSTDSAQSSLPGSSPTGTILEVQSLSDNEWTAINFRDFNSHRQSFDSYSGTVSNPSQNLHIRTNSDSSTSDGPQSAQLSGSYEEIAPWPLQSPHDDSQGNDYVSAQCNANGTVATSDMPPQQQSPTSSLAVSPTAVVATTSRTAGSTGSSSTSPSSSGPHSPPTRRRKSPTSKTTKAVIKKPSQTRKEAIAEKKVGRRKGPLRPDQRQQAHEIRKLRACLRCKFLKKTCDKGEPCGGCRPSHARLWQVPCTRMDIRDIAYFCKDWKADFERHVSLGFSIGNIKGFSKVERTLYITHGYGHYLPINAREVFVRDDKCFDMDWTESIHPLPKSYEVNTAKLTAGSDGVSTSLLSEYLDRHLDHSFENFVDEYFEGLIFVSEILKTAYRYYEKEKTPSVRKALKLVLAYNLTTHITMVEGLSEEEQFVGRIDADSSRFCGKTVAPVMINFQIKCALAEMWRELQKDILGELSALYSSVYSGDKLKNWPTIFMLAAILLAIWEEMQFDCHYRVPDEKAVHKFCDDMESTPVGVIVGLFQAISTKLPGLQEWDTRKHHHLLGSNPAVCDALTEVRTHINTYESYLKERQTTAKYERDDFDSLSSKFLSKLVIRAN